MANEKVISFDLKADFAFFKKPDVNDGLQLSYNMLHKPGLLGILGAIIGLEGYKRKGEMPEYYKLLKDLPVGIEPLQHERGVFQKATVKYTNGVGYANADGTLLIEETMLLKPAFRCYLMLDTSNTVHEKLYDYLKARKCEYIPYLGKNEFQAWIENVREWTWKAKAQNVAFQVSSLFVKNGSVRNQRANAELGAYGELQEFGTFVYFESSPVSFNEHLMQYEMANIAFTDWSLSPKSEMPSLFELETGNGENETVQFL